MNVNQCLRTSFLLLLPVAVAVQAGPADPVYIPDPVLKHVIKATLGITHDPNEADMLALTSLDGGAGIDTMMGIKYATNLRELRLEVSFLRGWSPLWGLANLESLELYDSWSYSTIDLSNLLGMTKLTRLGLHRVRPKDLSLLSNWPDLEWLDLTEDQISDLSPLSGMTHLTELWLGWNSIRDLSPLSGMTHLKTVNLARNYISDLSPLSGLTHLQSLELAWNCISNISPLCGLTELTFLDLSSPNVLDGHAYCHDLQTIKDANPGIDLRFEKNENALGGVVASDGTYADKVRITWDALCPGPSQTYTYTFSYMVYCSTSLGGAKEALSGWLSGTSFDDITASPGVHYWYWVKSDRSGETYSDPDEGWRAPLQTLSVSSTRGGSVVSPGEGTFQYNHDDQVMLEAKADPLFTFAGWHGNLSTDANPYALTMDSDYTIKACFESVLDVLYVDDNAPTDPGSGDPNLSDPKENGTKEHAFDTVQEAIDVAKKGAKIIVRPGIYLETIDLLGKRIEVNGLNADSPSIMPFPVINGQRKDTVVRCTQREDPNCVLTGFVVTGGRGRLAGGLLCVGSSPSIVNCLIVGNRATALDGGGGGIYCHDSKATLVNCTVAGNYGGIKGAGVWFKDSLAVVSNSIVWGNGPVEILASGAIQPVIGYTDAAGGWPGTGNLNADPLFAMPGHWANPNDLTKPVSASDSAAVWVPGDYHLKSQTGRWEAVAEKWVMDAVTSPCIDAGDPLSLLGAEPEPNGNRINVGAYGGTSQASLSR